MAILHRKHVYLSVVIILALVLSLSLLVTGCPTTQTYILATDVSPAGAGSVSPSGGNYDAGVTVTLTATPASGYTFDYWSGSASGTSSTTTVVMNAHRSVTAHFTPLAQTYTLTTDVSPAGAGSVSPSGGNYDAGVTVTLTASPASGYTFDCWSGSASGTSSTTTITMDSDKSVTAHFAAAGPTVLFSDDFSQDTGLWDTFSDSYGEAFYENGWFHVTDYSGAGPVSSFAHQYFTDCIIDVDMKLISGSLDNWQTVIFRQVDDDNYYTAEISADGYYEMQRWINGTLLSLVNPTSSSYIHQGYDVVNSVHIECIGNSFSLSVNGHLLVEVTDNTFTGGDIGLDVIVLSGSSTEVAFDNLVVTEP
jgi:uncharacterized repeat protein (TIGR02543 family)